MKEPSAAISEAVFAKLTASTAVKALIGDPARVYDKVVPGPTYPFVRVGDDQVNGDSNSCHDGWEAFVTVHIFSQHAQYPRLQAKDIANAVALAIGDNTSLPAVSGFDVLEVELQQSRVFMESDGVTAHGVITFRYLIDDGA